MKLKATMNTDNHQASGKDSTQNWTTRPAFFFVLFSQRHGSEQKPTSEVDILRLKKKKQKKTHECYGKSGEVEFQNCVAN